MKISQSSSKRVASLLAAAMLAWLACAHLAIAGQFPATRVTAAKIADDRSARPPKGAPDKPPGSATAPLRSEPSPVLPRGRAYLFRGAMGLIFSRGMDKLAARIQHAGITANVYEFTVCDLVASAALEKYREDPVPIFLIGHSMGGRCALQFSEKLQSEGIPVSLVVTIDPAHLSPEVPLNVQRFINIFLSKDVLGGGDIKPVTSFRGHYASYDLAKHDEVLHISIDKMDLIHQQLVAKIVELAATPAQDSALDPGPVSAKNPVRGDGEPFPLRYVVPPQAEIELWDSGMTITARAGDTLQTLAEQYHLPLWSLTQVNPMPANTLLAAGQHVVVPRHLASPAAASEPVLSRH